MISIFCDYDRAESAEPSDYTLVASQATDYVRLRQRIRLALNDEDHNLRVYLQSPLLAEWLGDLRDYSEQLVTWRIVDLRDSFQSRFGFPAPVELDGSAIGELGILSLPPPGLVAEDNPTGWLLSVYLGAAWEAPEPYPGHLADLANWAALSDEPHPALRRLAESRLREWGSGDPRYSIFIGTKWNSVGQSLLCRWALRHYPVQLVDGLGLAGVPLIDASRHAPRCVELLKGFQLKLKPYWELFFAKAQGSLDEVVEEALSQMSGLSQTELQALSDYIGRRLPDLSLSLVSRLHDCFRQVPNSSLVLGRLERRVPPAVPCTPTEEWDVSRWLAWATTEYMHYFAWVLRNGQPRDEQIRLAGLFSDWFVQRYPKIIFESRTPLVSAQYDQVCQAMESDPEGIYIWVVVDGLSWWQGEMLADLCQGRGLYVDELTPVLSTLPSITPVSKLAIVKGSLDTSEREQPLATVLRERLSRVHGHVELFNEPEELQSAIEADTQPGVYGLLYNALDAQNHESRTFTDDERTQGHLHALANMMSAVAATATQRGIAVCVQISSDHGSTLLPKDAAMLKLPSFGQEAVEEDDWPVGADSRLRDVQRTRACTLTRSISEEEKALLDKKWYVLEQRVFMLPQTMLIPRGYAYAKKRPRGWTHGGATPEEVIVPSIVLHPQPPDVSAPDVLFGGALLSDSPGTVSVDLTNPNAFPLEKVHLTAWGAQLEASFPVLAAREHKSLQIPVPAAGPIQRISLEWRLTCEAARRRCVFSGEASLPVRRMQTSQADELFEEMR